MDQVEQGCRIDALLAEARAGLDRVTPADLGAEMAAGALVVDTRPAEQRHRDGDLPGAVVIDRNVLEWRLDPTSPHHIPEAEDLDLRVIVVCNEGFSSSLAATTLRRLGLATDSAIDQLVIDALDDAAIRNSPRLPTAAQAHSILEAVTG